MTVLKAVIAASWGGTSGEWSIARDRPDRGGLRRPERRRQLRVAGARDVDGPPRARSAGERHSAPGGPGRWRVPGPQDPHAGGGDPGRRVAHRPRQRAAGRGYPGGAGFRVMAPSTRGTFLRAFT